MIETRTYARIKKYPKLGIAMSYRLDKVNESR